MGRLTVKLEAFGAEISLENGVREWILKGAGRIAAAALLYGLSGCVTPPEMVAPKVLPKREVELITLLKSAKDYAASGRVDLAELYFNRAQTIAPENASIASDLGYIYAAQGRLGEAELQLRRSLERAPEQLPTRDNYARVLYRDGRLEDARREYQTLLDYYWGYWGGPGANPPDEHYTVQDYVSTLRNLAIVEASLGEVDEAFCWSRAAVALGTPGYTMQHHARFVMMFGRSDLAVAVLRDTIADATKEIDPPVLLDYGIALAGTGQADLAKAVFEKITLLTKVDASSKLYAQLGLLHIAAKASDAALEESLAKTILEKSADICEQKQSTVGEYWPYDFRKGIEEVVLGLCKDNGKVFIRS